LCGTMARMATQAQIARYAWVRTAVLGALALVLALVVGDGRVTPVVVVLAGVGVALVAYALIRRDRDRR